VRRPIAAAITLLSLCLQPVTTTASAQVTLGQMSANVEYIGTIPLEAGTWSTARVHGHYLYVGGTKSFSIYDIEDPASPQLVSVTPTGVQFINEDLDTNGKLLLMSDERLRERFIIYDVRNKSAPRLLADMQGIRNHSYACVLRCRYAYGAGGSIVDIRKPTAPKEVGRWTEPHPGLWGFDTNEFAPGQIITGSNTLHYLDARKNVRKPKVRAIGGTPDGRIMHSSRWPRKGRDRFILVQGETSPKPQCDERSGAFMTWDATRWRKTHTFTMIDEFRVPAGNVVDGNPPVSAVGCSSTWFQEHSSFRNGGLVVGAFFDHGARFLNVTPKGQIEQVGYYTPFGGSVTGTYWANDEIVYAIDLVHGIDILRFNS
jgi:LVIVD repeat